MPRGRQEIIIGAQEEQGELLLARDPRIPLLQTEHHQQQRGMMATRDVNHLHHPQPLREVAGQGHLQLALEVAVAVKTGHKGEDKK